MNSSILDRDLTLTVVFTTLIILLLFAVMIITVFIARRQRAETRLSYERELRTAGREIQEQVLSHLSAELHDNIGQLLTLLRMQLEKEQLRYPALAPALAPAGQTLTDIVAQVRSLSHSLNGDLLAQKGLAAAIRQEADRLRQLGQIAVLYEYDGQPLPLKNDQQLIVFRIFQELVNNTLRHAGAGNMRITLNGAPFLLSVEDDGRGFDTAQLPASGAGLRNISRRAELAALRCTFTGSPGKGAGCTIQSI